MGKQDQGGDNNIPRQLDDEQTRQQEPWDILCHDMTRLTDFLFLKKKRRTDVRWRRVLIVSFFLGLTFFGSCDVLCHVYEEKYTQRRILFEFLRFFIFFSKFVSRFVHRESSNPIGNY